MAEEVGRLHVDVVRDRLERGVEALTRELRRLSAGSASITASQVPTESRSSKIVAAPRRTGAPTSAGSNCLPERRCASDVAPSSPPTRCATSQYSRQLRRCGTASGIASPFEPVRPAAAVPRLVRAAQALATPSGSPSSSARRAAISACVGEHVVELLVARRREREPDAQAVQRRVARPEPAHRRRPCARTLVGSWSYLPALQRDVVAEPLGLLVRVRVAADVDEQRAVVDDRPRLLVGAEPLGQPERDQALPQHVLHRLSEAEVDAERERGDELRQAHVPAIRVRAHGACSTPLRTALSRGARASGAGYGAPRWSALPGSTPSTGRSRSSR